MESLNHVKSSYSNSRTKKTATINIMLLNFAIDKKNMYKKQ